ncbi:hypothetical protein Tco_1220699 [Tanacetum coccineum]
MNGVEVGCLNEWLKGNVNKGEYVVMKAEADVVEELINNNAIELVDELFMECKHQGKKCKECKRPYWKCLALCGQLRDVGSSFEAEGNMENQTPLKLYETNKIKQNAVAGISRGRQERVTLYGVRKPESARHIVGAVVTYTSQKHPAFRGMAGYVS